MVQKRILTLHSKNLEHGNLLSPPAQFFIFLAVHSPAAWGSPARMRAVKYDHVRVSRVTCRAPGVSCAPRTKTAVCGVVGAYQILNV
jgi:hypothetical protein